MIQHGSSQRTENLKMDNLLKECNEVIDFIRNKHPDTNIVILGHSLGAAIAAKL